MKRVSVASMMVLVVALAACGGDGADTVGGDDAGTASVEEPVNDGGAVVGQQSAGQALVSVDGREYALEVSPAVDCSVAGDAITFSFWVGDNSVVLGGGANLYDDGWLGSIDLRVSEPEGEDGPVAYFPDLTVNGDGLSIEGDSMSYSGPMMKQPPNDGSNPEPVAVGNGTVSVTCP